MVVGIVASLAGFVKVRISKTQVDNTVFRLHYRWTTSFCYLCCALIAASDFIGSPIECQNADRAVTTYCWVTSTYTINTTTKKNDFTYYSAYGSDVHGLGTYDPETHERTFHAYYQWVPFVLFLQGCLFYLPHQLWKLVEGKQLDNLLQGLNVFSILDDSFEQKKLNIIKYMHNSWGLNKKYSVGYFCFEVMNLANVITQMFLLDKFFGGMFLHYGAKILLLPVEDDRGRFDPMIETFPRVTKCEFFMYGPSGTIQKRDYLCILPQNLLNEKIFLVMWIWFVLLSTITVGQLIFRLFMFQFMGIRLKLLENRGKLGVSYELESIVRHMHLGDFFLLYTIGKNVSALCFRDILKAIMEFPEVRNPTTPEIEKSSAPPLYPSPSFADDLQNDTIDLKLRKKITEESNL